MNNNEKKKINWIKTVRPVALALVLVFLLGSATYAWMKRDWTPTIHQDDVKIVAGSSLTFIFNNEKVEDISVNELLDKDEFVFKSVSNCTGKSDDFFALSYSPSGTYFDTYKKITLYDIPEDQRESATKYTELGAVSGYVELTFNVASAAEGTIYDQKIFLHEESKISGVAVDGNDEATTLNNQAANAIRVSVTVHATGNGLGENAERTLIFAANDTEHTGITNQFVSGHGYVAHGADRYDRSGESYKILEHITIEVNASSEDYALKKTTNEVKSFSDFASEPLFVLGKGTQRAITVRIWLEGEDDDCVDKIAGSALDILLKFKAEDVKENA